MRMPTSRSQLHLRMVGVVLGVVFIAAALSKAIDPRVTLSAFVYLTPESPALAASATRGLILLEAILGGVLVVGIGVRAALSCATLALSVFTAWLVWLWLDGATIRCGCGVDAAWLAPGAARSLAIGRNLVLISLAGLALFHTSNAQASQTRHSPSGGPLEAAPAVSTRTL